MLQKYDDGKSPDMNLPEVSVSFTRAWPLTERCARSRRQCLIGMSCSGKHYPKTDGRLLSNPDLKRQCTDLAEAMTMLVDGRRGEEFAMDVLQ